MTFPEPLHRIKNRRSSLLDFVEVDDAGCWVWTGYKNNYGYGQFNWEGFRWLVHRLAYTFCVGPIEPGLTVDHLCRNRGCLNPEHLEPVSNEENIQRGRWQPVLNAKKTHCMRGHAFDENNTYWTGRGERSCRICRNASSRAWKVQHG